MTAALAAMFVLAPVPAASAAPATTTGPLRTAALVDRDGNRISDGLQDELAGARASDRFEVIATSRAANPVADARRAAGSFTVHATFRSVRGFHATMTRAQIEALARSPRTIRIEENAVVEATLDASNRDFGTEAARAAFGVTGAGAGICVVDTGADPGHEQLDGAKIAGWSDVVGARATPYDDHGHGTHVLSIAAGDGTGGSLADRFKGVAPGAPAYVAKALDGAGSGSEADIIAAIDWCTTQPVAVISMSLGTAAASDGQDAMSQAANNAALDHGIATVVAAGNSGDDRWTVGSPGAGAHVITVGAVANHSVPPSSGYHSDGIYRAPFSSSGPTLDGRTKPDVMAPGVNIVAAQAGSLKTYVAYSGTSMATPFVAGTVALMLERNPGLSPSQVRSILEGTAADRGPAGKDDDWGAGLIDGMAAVAETVGGTAYDPTPFPANDTLSGRVSRRGIWEHDFALTADDLDVPIAATIMLDGELTCAWASGPWCFAWEWSPDLDAALIDPTGAVLYRSECPLGPDCGSVGRQETVHTMPTVAGTYTLQVYPFQQVAGGTFTVDLSRGPLAGTTPPPPPPPGNNAPDAADDSYSTAQDTALSVGAPGVLGNDTDADGDPLTASLVTSTADGSLSLAPDGSFTYTPDAGFAGTDSFTYVANDGTDDSAAATVTITVDAAPPPPPEGSVHVGDLDAASVNVGKNWHANFTIRVEDASHAPVAGAVVSYAWGDGTSGSCTTGGDGACTASTTLRKKDGSIALTVTNVAAPDPYEQTANHDPDGDSDGTTIIATKP